MTRLDFEYLDHGCDGEQYFPGCGVAFTHWTDCVTGIGDSAREAGEDALEQLAQGCNLEADDLARLEAELLDLSDAPSFDSSDPDLNPEWHHYVSLRWRFVEV
jgi:hypothetical protein